LGVAREVTHGESKSRVLSTESGKVREMKALQGMGVHSKVKGLPDPKETNRRRKERERDKKKEKGGRRKENRFLHPGRLKSVGTKLIRKTKREGQKGQEK